MLSETRINVDIKMIGWAFELTDLSEDRLKKIKSDTNWLHPDYKNYLNPTVKQLGGFASKLHKIEY